MILSILGLVILKELHLNLGSKGLNNQLSLKKYNYFKLNSLAD